MTDTGIDGEEQVLQSAARQADAVIDLARAVAEIPAPTFGEAQRSAFVREWFATQGLQPWVDDTGNVYARRAGSRRGALLIAAHTDTVFPLGTDLTIRRERERLVGPGIGDNSLAVAALLMLPQILDDADVQTGADLLLCADVGEEGLGDLRGIRRAVADHRDELIAVLALEGHGLGRVINTAVGSRRLRISVEGPGGHSWSAFGNPSAIHVLGRIITAVADIPVPADPKTTFNVGLIGGGVSINTIAPEAALAIDLRSVDPVALDDLVNRVQAIVDRIGDRDVGITVQSEIIGDRPAGSIDPNSDIVQTAVGVLRDLGIDVRLEAGSTDANIPISENIPAVCIGLTTGGRTHRLDEYVDLTPVRDGLQQLALLATRLGP